MLAIRNLFKSLSAVVLGLAIAWSPLAQAQTDRNILFIAVDDLRTWVGYMGDYAGTVHTPNIDALAAESTRFTNAYAAVPVCAGSRASVLLGMSPETHGVTNDNFLSTNYIALHYNPLIESLPEVMSANDYYSAGSGKVFHLPFPSKWDEQGPITPLGAMINITAGPDETHFHPSVLGPGETHEDQIVADYGSDFITNYTGGDPFFLSLGFFQPHVPWKAPQWAYDLYPLANVVSHTPIPGDLDDEPPEAVDLANKLYTVFGEKQHDAVVAAGKTQEYTRAYLAAISHTDAMIGEVLAALAASPHAANTDVILWSDHGYSLGEKFHWRKLAMWEEELKVPLLIKSPGNPNYPVGDVTRNVSLLDLAPTVMDLAGLAPFAQFEGKPLYVDDGMNTVFSYLNDGKATMINGFKVIDYDTTATPGIDDMAAYWLTVDPDESNNVILPLIIAILQGAGS